MMKLKIFLHFITITCVLFFASCGNELAENYRLNKKFWDAKDYDNAIYYIKFTKKEEKKPCYSVPEKAPIFKKIISKNNVSVVVEDKELGLKHRSEFITEVFKRYQKILKLYTEIDREDKFIYSLELVDILKFGLYIQTYYIDLTNQLILKDSDDPEASEVVKVIDHNEDVLVQNYCAYLDIVKQEEALSEEALDSYIAGINEYFYTVIKKYPKANFSDMIYKTKAMLNKTKSSKMKKALNKLLSKLTVE